jgi:hypothetical protein
MGVGLRHPDAIAVAALLGTQPKRIELLVFAGERFSFSDSAGGVL